MKTTKKAHSLLTLIVLTGLLMSISSTAIAQRPKELRQQDKIETMKRDFLKEKLSLTKEESAAFWPVYDQFHADQKKLNRSQLVQRYQLKVNYETLSDKELDDIFNSELVYQQALLDLKKDYHMKLKKVLPMRKTADYYMLEREFRRSLLKKSAGSEQDLD